MHLVIKNPAETGPGVENSGDFHFGAALQRALEGLGVTVTQQYWPTWDAPVSGADSVLVLRGRHRYIPPPGQLAGIWVISHPASVTVDELDRFAIAWLGSETHVRMLDNAARTPLKVLRQCSEFRMAVAAPVTPDAGRAGTLFVGNSRGVFRDIVRWSVLAGVRPALIGRGWEPIGLAGLVQRTSVSGNELPALYADARIGLNDHWNDMRHFGYINNRVFDHAASGLPTLSDRFDELVAVFGDSILYADGPDSFRDSHRRALADYPMWRERTQLLGKQVMAEHSFAARAKQIVADLHTIPKSSTVRTFGLSEEKKTDAGRFGILGEVMAALDRNGRAKTNREVLHLHPSAPGAAAFASLGVKTLTAGLGPGPWEVSLDPGIAQVAHRRFDLVFVEDTRSPGARLDRRAILRLGRLVRRGGYLVLPNEGGAVFSDRRPRSFLSDAHYRSFAGPRTIMPRSKLARRAGLILRTFGTVR